MALGAQFREEPRPRPGTTREVQRLQRKHNGGKEWPQWGGAGAAANNEQGMRCSTEVRAHDDGEATEDVTRLRSRG